jgi:hypothetical protein
MKTPRICKTDFPPELNLARQLAAEGVSLREIVNAMKGPTTHWSEELLSTWERHIKCYLRPSLRNLETLDGTAKVVVRDLIYIYWDQAHFARSECARARALTFLRINFAQYLPPD